MKEVVDFNISVCPLCHHKMYLMESKFSLYEFNETGTSISRNISNSSCSDLLCSNEKCKYHTEAVHSVYGIYPKDHYKIKKHEKELEEGQKYKGIIGYVEE